MNELSADACGVFATVIPIYLLLLWGGRSRLMPRLRRKIERIFGASAIVLWTAAEVVALYGVALGGLDGLLVHLVMGSVAGGVLTGALVMIVDLFVDG